MAKIYLEVAVRQHKLRPKYKLRGEEKRSDAINFSNDCLTDDDEFESIVKWAQNHLRELMLEARQLEVERLAKKLRGKF